MPWINLIEDQRIADKTSERKARAFLGVFAGTFSVSLLGFGFLLFQSEVSTSEESRLKAKAQKVAPLISHISELQTQLNVMNPKLKTLEGAQETSARWSRILQHLTVQTPPQTWLTAIRCTATDPTKPIAMSLVGLSDRQELVGEFILRLQGSSDLGNVGLKFTQEKVVSIGRNIEFEVNADINGTAEQKKEVKEETEKS